jgi:hypothetical protein
LLTLLMLKLAIFMRSSRSWIAERDGAIELNGSLPSPPRQEEGYGVAQLSRRCGSADISG